MNKERGKSESVNRLQVLRNIGPATAFRIGQKGGIRCHCMIEHNVIPETADLVNS